MESLSLMRHEKQDNLLPSENPQEQHGDGWRDRGRMERQFGCKRSVIRAELKDIQTLTHPDTCLLFMPDPIDR